MIRSNPTTCEARPDPRRTQRGRRHAARRGGEMHARTISLPGLARLLVEHVVRALAR